MATVISGASYHAIATDYATAKTTTASAKDSLYAAVVTIADLTAITPQVDLLNVFWDTYNINVQTLTADTLYMSAVRAINQHVLTVGGYETVDDYLLAEGILVPQAWADLSAEAGYVITRIG